MAQDTAPASLDLYKDEFCSYILIYLQTDARIILWWKAFEGAKSQKSCGKVEVYRPERVGSARCCNEHFDYHREESPECYL